MIKLGIFLIEQRVKSQFYFYERDFHKRLTSLNIIGYDQRKNFIMWML